MHLAVSRLGLRLFLMVAILLGIAVARQKAGPMCGRMMAGLSGQSVGVAVDEDAAGRALDGARGLSLTRRLELHLEWIARGSRAATISLELWLEKDFPANTLPGPQQRRLEEVALGWPAAAVRRAAAGALLAHFGDSLPLSDPRHIACRLVRSESSSAAVQALVSWARAHPRDWRWVAAAGAAGVPALVEALASGQETAAQGISLLVRAHPESRRLIVPALIEALAAKGSPALVRLTLVEVADRDLGADPAQWASWWGGVEETLERLAR